MSDNYIRNREGKIIAHVDGSTLRSGSGKIVAIYYPAEDLTRDRTGRIAGKGDQRLRLLPKRETANEE